MAAPSQAGGRVLRTKGALDYIVVHTDLYDPAEWKEVEKRLGRFSTSLTIEHVEAEGRACSRH